MSHLHLLAALVVSVLFIQTACGASPSGRTRGASVDEPVMRRSDVEEGSREGPRAAEALAPPPSFEPCAGVTSAVAGLDASPSVQQLGAPTVLTRASHHSSRSGPLLGDHPGFGWWMTANGRFALVYRFVGGPLQFGHHGEVRNATAELHWTDLSSESSERFDDLLTVGPLGRWVALRRGSELWLLGADGQRIELTREGADARDDQNRCLPRRQVGFDPSGRRIAWMARSPHRAVVRDLGSGRQCQVAAGPGILWRVFPEAIDGWTMLREIPADSDGDGRLSFPVQRTSCACRWCGRFARSHGFYGWGGDAVQSVMIAPDGSRIPLDQQAHPVGRGALALIGPNGGSMSIVDTSGQPISIPTGCDPIAVAAGAPSVILACGAQHRLWFPDDGRTLDLPVRVEASGVVSSFITDAGHVWAALRAATPTDAADMRLARLRMNDGRIELGPPAGSLTDRAGPWAVARTSAGAAYLHLGDGRSATVNLADVRSLNGFAAVLGNGNLVALGPESGRYLEHPVGASLVDARGCALVPSGTAERGLEMGPWRMTCP